MKPIVHYKPNEFDSIHVGVSARIMEPLDHPSELVSNTQPIVTSMVIEVGGNGVFETMNTLYVPKND